MKSLNEIECETPLGFSSQTTVPVSLLFNENVLMTKFNYTFWSEEYFQIPKSVKKKKFLTKVFNLFTDFYKGAKSVFD